MGAVKISLHIPEELREYIEQRRLNYNCEMGESLSFNQYVSMLCRGRWITLLREMRSAATGKRQYRDSTEKPIKIKVEQNKELAKALEGSNRVKSNEIAVKVEFDEPYKVELVKKAIHEFFQHRHFQPARKHWVSQKMSREGFPRNLISQAIISLQKYNKIKVYAIPKQSPTDKHFVFIEWINR